MHYYVKVFCFLACTVLVNFVGYAQKKLVILGSSTSACAGPSIPDSCYVARLQQYYGSLGIPIAITNLAVGGATVYRAMPSSYVAPMNRETPDISHNITAALATNPDVILVNFPSNGYDIFSVAEVMFCLRTIKQVANSSGKPCYLTTTQPRSEPSSFSTSETRRKMAEIKEGVLNEFGSFGINFWDGIVNPADSTILPVYNSGDGIHLNNAAHGILAQRVEQKNIFGQQPGTAGLKYRYYEGNWSTLPNFDTLPVLKAGTIANIDLSVRNVDDNFGIIWEGYVNIPTPGTYTFETVSDDGSKLYFNSTYSPGAPALVNNDGLHPTQSASGTIYIPSAGQYPVAMTFFKKAAEKLCRFIGLDRAFKGN